MLTLYLKTVEKKQWKRETEMEREKIIVIMYTKGKIKMENIGSDEFLRFNSFIRISIRKFNSNAMFNINIYLHRLCNVYAVYDQWSMGL